MIIKVQHCLFFLTITMALIAQGQICADFFVRSSTPPATPMPPATNPGLDVRTKASEILTGNKLIYGVTVGGDERISDYLKNAKGGRANAILGEVTPHDKGVSEELFPTDMATDPRYVKEAKITSMLTQGMNTIKDVETIKARLKKENKQLLVYAFTAETHAQEKGLAWIGVRVQFADNNFYEIHLQVTLHHVGATERSTTQQWDLGRLGINLIHGVMKQTDVPNKPAVQARLIDKLFDNFRDPTKSIKLNSIKISKVNEDGSLGENLVNSLFMAKKLFQLNMARSLFVLPDGNFIDPPSLFHGKDFQFFDVRSEADITSLLENSTSNPSRTAIAVVPTKYATQSLITSLKESGIIILLESVETSAQDLVNQKREYILKLLRNKYDVYGPKD